MATLLQSGDELPVAQLLVDIASRSVETRRKVARALKQQIEGLAIDANNDRVSRVLREISGRLGEMLQSTEPADRLGALSAIDALIDLDIEERATLITRFASYLHKTIPFTETAVMVAAADTLGALAKVGQALIADFVEYELRRLLEWLTNDRAEPRRIMALLATASLARNAPALFQPHLPAFFDGIWGALRDPKINIREFAATSLEAVLHLLMTRDEQWREQWLIKAYDECTRLVKQPADAVHGGILAIMALMRQARTFMHAKFSELLAMTMHLRDHKDKLVRRSVLSLFSPLARLDTAAFVAKARDSCVTLLVTAIRQVAEKPYAYTALAEVAEAIGEAIEPHVDAVCSLTRKEWSSTKKRIPESVQCLAQLAAALGDSIVPVFAKYTIMDLLFSYPISETLVQSFILIANNVPQLLSPVQEHLLTSVSQILARQASGAGKRRLEPAQQAEEEQLVLLALDTLRTFDFRPHPMADFLRDCLGTFLEADSSDVRARAVRACTKLMRDMAQPQTGRLPTRGHTAAILRDIIDRLLVRGISDPEFELRNVVLSSLDPAFDEHLAQPENLRALFIALNDEAFENREVAIGVIGRLTARNPAYVMPSLRKTLIQLLTELQFSADARNKEESARLLGRLISAADRLVRPYVHPILAALIPKLRESPAPVAASVLGTLAELSRVAGDALVDRFDELLPLVIDSLSDHGSATKRCTALKTLASLVQSTGNVVTPYRKYPDLLPQLLDCLKGIVPQSIRQEALRVLGVLGALSPHDYAELTRSQGITVSGTSDSEVLPGMGTPNDAYYPAAALAALTALLRDSTLSAHHMAAVQAVVFIFRSLGLRSVPYLQDVMPPLISVVKTAEAGLREFMFQQLGELVAVVKSHVRPYLADIVQLAMDYWDTALFVSIIRLIEEMSLALQDEFKIHLPALIPPMLRVLSSDRTDGRAAAMRVLHAFEALGCNLDDYLYLVVPAIVHVAEASDVPLPVRQAALATLTRLCKRLNVADYASRIVHPLARILNTNATELGKDVCEVLCVIIQQLGPDYTIFVPMVSKVLSRQRVQHSHYEELSHCVINNKPLPAIVDESEQSSAAQMDALAGDAASNAKMHVNQQSLKKAWEGGTRTSREDWTGWLRRFATRLLGESPSPALRACAGLAAVYPQLANSLFNAAFVSCWSELYDQYQDELTTALEAAFRSPSIPPEVLQTFLGLAEFMEHDLKPLPIDCSTLSELAVKCHAYAKALHYKEMEFVNKPAETIEDLISFNNQLQQPEAAVGVLRLAQQRYQIQLKEEWYETLRRWDDALGAYERKQIENPLDVDLTIGRMRCLNAKGEWERLISLCSEVWGPSDPSTRARIAPIGAAGAFHLRRWDLLTEYTSEIDRNTIDGTWYHAIVAFIEGRLTDAANIVGEARALLDSDVVALVGEGYKRAYRAFVTAQQLTELEEVLLYADSTPERRADMCRMWNERLNGVQRSVDVWQRVLAVRSLVVPPREDVHSWIRFATLCRRSNRASMSQRALAMLLPGEWSDAAIEMAEPAVQYACLRHLWDAAAARRDAAMQRKTRSMMTALLTNPSMSKPLAARCHLRLSEWSRTTDEFSAATVREMILHAQASAHLDPTWWKAWHAWAIVNYEAIEREGANDDSEEFAVRFVVPAVDGFIESIALAPRSSAHTVQDTLRLLTLWFKYGQQREVRQTLSSGFGRVSIDTWLQVIPQLIARVHTPARPIRKLVHELLIIVGKQHPQALVYPLTVTAKSHSKARVEAARQILKTVSEHSPNLVRQAALVSDELIRVAVLWHERWHSTLDEASRLYYSEKNPKAMMAIIKPLHDMIARGTETMREESFQQAFGRDLEDALEWAQKFQRTKRAPDMSQAWELYVSVFKRINKQLPQLMTLDLQYVSPLLLEARNLDLAVPGTYVAGNDVVRIRSFSPTLNVIASKQRPRKLTIIGSDEKEYMFLLKGHEDLRQDERVMQLLGLVNSMLDANPETRKRDLGIHRYAVVPLSPETGLLSWVQTCDTLHALVKEYREARRVVLNVEYKYMTTMAPNYDRLCVIQKVEVFQYALKQTSGSDLLRVLWLKSRNSEKWLDRRTNYTRSLAVMSMVGYILGLGDRHPSNLMLDRVSGKLMHIDFGDCFEVAMHRDKFPERVPFRLTRMLIQAMEVSGIEGNFRITCELVMSVLRANKDSVMAMLEAFVYDPLINWRLLAPSPTQLRPQQSQQIDVDEQHEVASSPLRRAAIAEEQSAAGKTEQLNARAVEVIRRVRQKLTGRDFDEQEELDVGDQVDRLINQATSHENLCQLYVGWCPFW